MTSPRPTPRVSVVSLGCSRNDVDSSELAGRLADGGWELVDDARSADVAVVNTCGFIAEAKKDSIDVMLDLADGDDAPTVVAVGCLAERYGEQLAEELPEAAAVLGFDSYADMSTTLKGILEGERPTSHTPRDRRQLLPLSPVDRQAAPAPAPPVSRQLGGAPWEPLKLASGCDRRCAFCAIPVFRGAFVSRPPEHVIAEAQWLAARGVKEVFLVSENTTSYGKDLGDIRALELLLPELAKVEGIERIRVSYLQPAEIRPGLLGVIAATPKVSSYFDVSFQHASATMLRRMRRFGSVDAFLELVAEIRGLDPDAGIRSNAIVGFPGETDAEFADLLRFADEAMLDVLGVFTYSDEDGTEAAGLPGKVDDDVIEARAAELRRVAEAAGDERAAARVGSSVTVLVESTDDDTVVGRADHQGPDVDGVTSLVCDDPVRVFAVGDLVAATVVDHDGVDLIAQV